MRASQFYLSTLKEAPAEADIVSQKLMLRAGLIKKLGSGLYTWMMVEGLVGLFQRHFAGNRGWWKYLADSSYWCYLAGFPVQVGLQVWLADTPMSIAVKFLLVNALTFAVLLATYELAVRHTWLGLLLNGKRPERTPAAVAGPVVIAARVRVDAPHPEPTGPRWQQPDPVEVGTEARR